MEHLRAADPDRLARLEEAWLQAMRSLKTSVLEKKLARVPEWRQDSIDAYQEFSRRLDNVLDEVRDAVLAPKGPLPKAPPPRASGKSLPGRPKPRRNFPIVPPSPGGPQ